MATTKKMTEVQALAAVQEILKNLTPEQIVELAPEMAEAGWTAEELIGKNDHMLESRSKKREKDPNAKPVKTKARIENEELAPKVAELMKDHPEGVSSNWVMTHVQYITSTQKVTSVMNVAKELGLITSKPDPENKGKVLYFLAE